MNGRGWTRTSSLLFVRQALYAVELLAHVVGIGSSGTRISTSTSAFRAPVSWPLDDPGRKRSVVHATRLRFDPGSRRRHRCRASSWRRSGARRSSPSENSQAKAAVVYTASFTAFQRARTFLSQAGPRCSSPFSSSWASPRDCRGLAFKRRRRPSRVALASSCYAATGLAVAPPSEGLVIIGPQQAERLPSARRAGRDIGRGRGKRFDVDVTHLH